MPPNSNKKNVHKLNPGLNSKFWVSQGCRVKPCCKTKGNLTMKQTPFSNKPELLRKQKKDITQTISSTTSLEGCNEQKVAINFYSNEKHLVFMDFKLLLSRKLE